MAMQTQQPQTTLQDGDFCMENGPLSARVNADMPISPCESHFTRSSSVYTTDSAHSSSSADTTISRIIEMYTDLVTKVAGSDTAPNDDLIQPKAYRDTIAPLLMRLGIDEHSTSFASSPTASIVPKPYMMAHQSGSILRSSGEQASHFHEGLKNSTNSRAESVSPLSLGILSRSDYSPDGISEPDSAINQIRPFSWAHDNVQEHEYMDWISKSTTPYHEVTYDYDQERIVKTDSVQQHPLDADRYTISAPVASENQWRSSTDNSLGEPYKPFESDRFYSRHIAGSDSTESLIIYNDIADAVKTKVKEKKKPVEQSVGCTDVATSTISNYSYLQSELKTHSLRPMTHPLESQLPVLENQRDRLTVELEAPRLCTELDFRKTQGQPGFEIRQLKEQKPRHAYQRRSDSQAVSRESYQSKHRKTSSSIDSVAPNKRKGGLLAALEGAKHSLTHNSAEKRRERLKESIVVVGPAQLLSTNVLVKGRSVS